MRVTIKDIARECGLSVTAVSLVLNGKGNKISRENTERILETAERMRYRPNQLAVGLVKKKTFTLGLIVPDITNIFFSELAKGVEDTGRKNGYNVILCNTDDKNKLEKECINTLSDKGVDGILAVMAAESHGQKGEESIGLLQDSNIPAVVVDCFMKQKEFSSVSVDNEKGAYMAGEYLIGLGHRRIGCVAGPYGPLSNEKRLDGYRKALEKNGIVWNEALVYEGDFRYGSGLQSVERLLPENPTAILCMNDMMAYGVLAGLKKRGVRVPQEISVVGFDDIFFSDILDIPLTTVRQPAYELGEAAVSRILKEIEGSAKGVEDIVLEPRLVVRKSSGPIA